MTVFEIQVNPERNALIRRALAKRIVRQREVEEEEASTEEDESFLGSSITIARKGSAASVSTTGSAGNKEHQRIKTDGGGRMNAKSRWKSEYLRTRSSSPSPSGSSFMSAISEILPPEMLPQILPATLLNGNSSLDRQKTDSVRSDADGALVKTLPLGASDGGAATVSVTLNGAPLSSGEAAISTDPIQAEKRAAKPEPGDTAPAAIAIEETGPDPVERDLLLKLEGLRKEKSRLFALFRNALQKKEESSKSPQPHPPSHSTSKEPESLLAAGQAQDTKSSGAADPAGSRSVSAAAATDHLSKDQEPEDGRQGGASEARVLGRLSDHSHERRPEPLSRQTSKSRREYERVFDRSKLNLEIPRKPSISSASSNSTSSTPTTSFPPPKRGRSRSPSVDGGGPFNNSNRGSSGPGSFGPSFPSTSYSSSSSSHAESTSYPSKYPRADYMGSSQQQQQQQQQHHRNPSNSSSNNGLPDKPQGRYHTSSHFQQHASSSARSLGGDSYHADEGGYSSRSKGSSSGPGLNGGSGSGSYRQNGPMNYHSQGPPPPTRIGFGDNGGNSGSNSSGRSGGGGGGGSGGNTVSRGGFYGHGHDGPPTAPISMLGPSGRTHMPFNRSMMQMPHNRGLAHGRIGFGNGGSGGGGGGGRNGGGPPDRSMSSARPGDWSRRRSRA